jgi:hypothetical protein
MSMTHSFAGKDAKHGRSKLSGVLIAATPTMVTVRLRDTKTFRILFSFIAMTSRRRETHRTIQIGKPHPS